jgi:lysophospholipase L1-like esterase
VKRRRGALASVVAVALVCCTAGCGGNDGSSSTAARATVTVEAPQTLLVMGTSATFGVGLADPFQDAWPRIFFREAFPRTTVFFNGALVNSSAAEAEVNQLPLVAAVSPSVVAIWFGAEEASLGVPAAQFAADLGDLVRRVRASGARVLLADLPQSGNADVGAYNEAIARVAADEGATLVPLHEARISSFDRAHVLPDVAGHRAIARAFERALRS